jgi:hypothetical protein
METKNNKIDYMYFKRCGDILITGLTVLFQLPWLYSVERQGDLQMKIFERREKYVNWMHFAPVLLWIRR